MWDCVRASSSPGTNTATAARRHRHALQARTQAAHARLPRPRTPRAAPVPRQHHGDLPPRAHLANTAIIVGGSFLANADLGTFDSADTQSLEATENLAYLKDGGEERVPRVQCGAAETASRGEQKGKVHPTVLLLLLAWIELIVRGMYGVLQSADFALSYYNPNSYSPNGFTAHYTLVEYVMRVTTEWLACVILSCTYITSKGYLRKLAVRSRVAGGEM
ncbi:hypothetical protein B0H13DRAFT_2471672 [Mycena leptocephala]|nr:hypothetical protein B0H13DRAFT_2471672 [Mycena leptocephala]